MPERKVCLIAGSRGFAVVRAKGGKGHFSTVTMEILSESGCEYLTVGNGFLGEWTEIEFTIR